MYFIYFIKVAKNIKIGICKATLKHIKQRLSEANRWSPNSEILGVILTDDDKLEKAIHFHFKDYKISNEVFRNEQDIRKFIKKYCHWERSKQYLCYSWQTIKAKEIKFKDKPEVRFKYRNNKAKPSVKISLWEWCKYGDLRHKHFDIIDKMYESKELIHCRQHDWDIGWYTVIKKKKSNIDLSIFPENYPQGWIEIEAYEDFEYEDYEKFETNLWNKISEAQLLDIEYIDEYSYRFLYNEILSNYLGFLRARQNEVKETDYKDERDYDFTGIGDDGFHYVDGYFNICDPLGIESY